MTLTKTKYMILQFIKDNASDPYLTQAKVAKELKLNQATVSKVIAVLLAERKVKVIQLGAANILIAVHEEEENG